MLLLLRFFYVYCFASYVFSNYGCWLLKTTMYQPLSLVWLSGSYCSARRLKNCIWTSGAYFCRFSYLARYCHLVELTTVRILSHAECREHTLSPP